MMKIKEAVNRIESTSKSMFAWEHEGYIHITFNTFTILVVPYEAKTMFDCHFVNPNLELPADVKAQISGIIGKFLRTPIKERYPDKKYRLRWIDSNGISNYLDNREGVWTTESITNARCYTESELEQLKKDNPRLAPAIEAMKEPAEGKDE
ncbi:hypothetical protein [Limosilactobacillus reuteri]|uniref:hypothetical protein n=1 Tax=Limosilactobacillus reuteri TaxID=1598 RepID=UPI001C5A94D4|nr:hypothetical protein [Limosilactobacillus reuteri]MBW3349869.1 hypothetical protein [Limosilactobacillus reuteri]UUW67719.1 hypothetical protein NUJ10_06750 [Limosilactobacillus reuteri]